MKKSMKYLLRLSDRQTRDEAIQTYGLRLSSAYLYEIYNDDNTQNMKCKQMLGKL